jgi:hypothetical protein
MFNENIESQIIGTLKIFDKDSGEVLVQKRNAIHPGNMAYVLASALAGKPVSVNANGSSPYIGWMAFGNGGSNSTTTLSYRSPRVFSVYDNLPITSSNSRLYAKTYQQRTTNTVYYPGEDMGDSEIVPDFTSKIKFSVEIDKTQYAAMNSAAIPENDSLVAPVFTIDEIGLLSGNLLADTNDWSDLDEDKTLMLTHVTFHPVLISANRTIVIDYTVTIQIN